MSENKPSYIEGIGWRYETLHNMHRRMQGHDYRDRCIYMITIATEGRKTLLGKLRWEAGKPEGAWIEPTALGQEVEMCWLAIKEYYPGVVPLALQLMPDHIHGMLYVTREQKAHLGQIVNGFKVGCNRAFRRLFPKAMLVESPEAMLVESPEAMLVESPEAMLVESPEAMPLETEHAVREKRTKHPTHGMLFEVGYHDSILMGKGQLKRMFQYIADNPKRLAIKREKPDLFRVVREVKIKYSEAVPVGYSEAVPIGYSEAVPVGYSEAVPQKTEQGTGTMTFAAIGNGWLLQRADRMQVRCHNNSTPDNLLLIAKQKEYFPNRGRKDGAVVVSPCISAGEKEIAKAALDAGVPLIVILENGFPPMYKPPGRYFEACAKGLLLMLAPWPYHTEQRTITRSQCLTLNEMAYRMSTEPWTEELEKRMKNGTSCV